jgi:hypothetical protein
MMLRQNGYAGSMNMIGRYLLALGLTLLLGGCASGVIQSVELGAGEQPAVNKRLNIIIGGTGTCGALNVNWGDAGNTWDTFTNVDLEARDVISHTYTGWRGGKTITVEPQARCSGTAQMRFTTTPSTMSFGWARLPSGMNPTSCFMVPSSASPGGIMPPLTANTLVRVMGAPTPQVNFGCRNNGCIYDPDGRPGTSAAAPFSFPGFREYSLVMRLGGATLFQGGKSERFAAPTGGGLEFCQNTDTPTANITGGWQIDLKVDELGFPARRNYAP